MDARNQMRAWNDAVMQMIAYKADDPRNVID